MKRITTLATELNSKNCLLLIRPTNNYYVEGDNFKVTPYWSEQYQPMKLVHKETLKFEQFSQMHCFSSHDCDLDTLARIFLNRGWNLSGGFDILVFSEYAYNTRNIIDPTVVYEWRENQIKNQSITD